MESRGCGLRIVTGGAMRNIAWRMTDVACRFLKDCRWRMRALPELRFTVWAICLIAAVVCRRPISDARGHERIGTMAIQMARAFGARPWLRWLRENVLFLRNWMRGLRSTIGKRIGLPAVVEWSESRE